ncbi:metal cation symporter ZIP14-like isoform X1 [Patiria miniata]|uniref:Zinc transporter ZIP14 n=1 Tax=Patiria miniata TaxID=46514 RepID=A0A913ZQ50_PATMI|nr:metal cation symporter ZIP14-like isoform X1 [Patiria miniata]XP_038053258.1 metal cation symporter ZIP14-like isoform X1 [Patiria miniata]XP_038053260.1 metal cation symporter ZIP14-like isoform X1 [Patiria miniata]
MSRKSMNSVVCFLSLFCIVTWTIFAPVGATSTGPRGGLDRRIRSLARRDATTAAGATLPDPDFFLRGIVDKFGRDGQLDKEQLQILLQRVKAQCYSVDDLLSIHSLTEERLLNDTSDVLLSLCPTVLYQSASDDCSDLETESGERQPPTLAQVWGYGVLFVTIINLSALMGAFIVPCMNKKVYKLILTYLVGLAVGTLSGNAILSLIPETHGMYVSTHGLGFVWRNTTVIVGIYLFFVVERLLKLVSSRKELKRKKKKESSDELADMQVTAMHDMTKHHDIYKITSGDSAMGNGFINAEEESTEDKDEKEQFLSIGPNAGFRRLGNIENDEQQSTQDATKTQISNGHGHSHMALTDDGKVRIAAVAYMIIFGDGLHNFVDGLAIGASFSISVFQGISTSVAVICEEFPHELGDFAILLKSGMTVKQALTFNLLSALTCYGGLVVGILVGQLTSLEPYIFALAGGMFLYISLVDMLPELTSVNQHEDFNLRSSLKIFAIQNAGLLTGYVIMILLTVYGEHIAV